jgi:hypothetical protein
MAEDVQISTEQIAKALKQLSGLEATEKGFPHLGDALKPGAEAYTSHKGLAGEAEEYLKQYEVLRAGGHIELKDKKIFLKESVTDAAVNDAVNKFRGAEQKLAAIPQESAKHLEALSSKLGGGFGRVHSHGGFSGESLGKTVKSHLFDDFKNNKPVVFGRLVGVGLGGLALTDSLFRSTTSDGEDRSLIVRGAELGIGAGAVVLALIAGKAKTLALAK